MSNLKSNPHFLLQFIKPELKKITVVSILEILTIIISILIPYFLGQMISNLEQNTATIKLLLENFFIASVLYLVWDLLSIQSEIKFAHINKNIQNHVRKYCYTQVFNSNITLVESVSEGEIINKLLMDTEKLERAFLSFFRLIISILSLLAAIISMYFIHKKITLILTLFFILLLIFQRLFSHQLKTGYATYKISEEDLTKNLKNFLSGFMNIKIFSLEDKCISILNNNNTMNFNNYLKLNKVTSFYSNISFFIISLFRITAILLGGIFHLVYHTITLGGIFTIYSYAIQLTTQLRTIIQLDIIIKDVMTSVTRITTFINKFNTPDIHLSTDHTIDSIQFNDLQFQYHEKIIFKNLNANFEKNDIVGIIGTNGSGKTTLMKLICGFYKCDNLLYNNNSQSLWSNKNLLKRISYVPQNIFLFPGTILDNISCFGTINEHEVYSICKTLNIHDKILSLENGYHTMIEENNLNLSGGEKQILCIARALLKESDILILDEINSALDKTMEENIINNIKTYYQNKIVFIISHKNKILNDCTTIINLDDFKN